MPDPKARYNNPNDASDSLNGKSVRQILATAEIALGGGALPLGYDFVTLSELCANLDLSWDTVVGGICQPSAWTILYLSKPSTP